MCCQMQKNEMEICNNKIEMKKKNETAREDPFLILKLS